MYEPEWSESVAGWAVNYLKEQVWRVAPVMDLDDLMQEAFLLFLRLVERCEFESPAHFMAVWKLDLSRELSTWASRRTKRKDCVSGGASRAFVLPDFSLEEEREFEERCEAARGPVKALLLAVRQRTRRPRRRRADGRRWTTNEYLCRFARLPLTTPLRRLFEDWLKDA